MPRCVSCSNPSGSGRGAGSIGPDLLGSAPPSARPTLFAYFALLPRASVADGFAQNSVRFDQMMKGGLEHIRGRPHLCEYWQNVARIWRRFGFARPNLDSHPPELGILRLELTAFGLGSRHLQCAHQSCKIDCRFNTLSASTQFLVSPLEGLGRHASSPFSQLSKRGSGFGR